MITFLEVKDVRIKTRNDCNLVMKRVIGVLFWELDAQRRVN